jgi:hypothetical protein
MRAGGFRPSSFLQTKYTKLSIILIQRGWTIMPPALGITIAENPRTSDVTN